MNILGRPRLQALLCALLVLACVLLAHPFAETGLTDDWSYIRTAQMLAATGRVTYNGWAAPALVWLVIPAALAIKVFGFSFTVARATTWVGGALTAYLLQRTAARCGLRERNATLGTLTVMLSPLVVPAVSLFLTDIWGLCALLYCLYCCLRALATDDDRAAIFWICNAALGNALIGTVRQIAWLGVLVMVPSVLWLVRARPRVLRGGLVACAAGYATVAGFLVWLGRQAYTLPEPLYRPGLLSNPHGIPEEVLRPALEIPMLLLPVLILFLPVVRGASRRRWTVLGVGIVVCGVFAIHEHHLHRLTDWLVPFMVQHGGLFSRRGMLGDWPVRGVAPDAIPLAVRLVLAAGTVAGVVCWLASLVGRRPQPLTMPCRGIPSWYQLLWLTLPFAAGYVVLLAPRGLMNSTIDRYLIPLVAVAMILLVRWYQEQIRPDIPWLSLALVAIFAAFSVAETHDGFALYRAVLAATAEVQAAGVPRTRLDGGWEYNSWTQLMADGYIHTNGIRMPDGKLVQGIPSDRMCRTNLSTWLPDVDPTYALSFDPEACGGVAAFMPVEYERWLAPHSMRIYVVKNPQRPDEPVRQPGVVPLSIVQVPFSGTARR